MAYDPTCWGSPSAFGLYATVVASPGYFSDVRRIDPVDGGAGVAEGGPGQPVALVVGLDRPAAFQHGSAVARSDLGIRLRAGVDLFTARQSLPGAATISGPGLPGHNQIRLRGGVRFPTGGMTLYRVEPASACSSRVSRSGEKPGPTV